MCVCVRVYLFIHWTLWKTFYGRWRLTGFEGRVHRLPESLLHHPAVMQLRFGGGRTPAGTPLGLVGVQQVEQRGGVLLARQTQSLRGQRVGDGGQPGAVAVPGGKGVPHFGRVVQRAQAEQAAGRGNLGRGVRVRGAPLAGGVLLWEQKQCEKINLSQLTCLIRAGSPSHLFWQFCVFSSLSALAPSPCRRCWARGRSGRPPCCWCPRGSRWGWRTAGASPPSQPSGCRPRPPCVSWRGDIKVIRTWWWCR